MNAEYWIKKLNLEPHPEGGHYKETYQSDFYIDAKSIKESHGEARRSSTLIYYLLNKTECSHFHRLKSDEVWIYNQGATLRIYIISQHGVMQTKKLGPNIDTGEQLQVVVKANCWFAAELEDAKNYSLLTCLVSPGFVFHDFELANKQELINRYKQHSTLINKLSF